MKYLVTDPCYVIASHDDWLAVLDEHGYDDWTNVKCDIGTILEATGTANGDGAVRVSGNKIVSADAGMTCIVEITNQDAYNEVRHGNAVTNSLETATRWFEKARQM